MKTPTLKTRILALILVPLLLFSLSPPLQGAVTGRTEDTSIAGTEKILSDSSGTDTYILASTLRAVGAMTSGTITGTTISGLTVTTTTGTLTIPNGVTLTGPAVSGTAATLAGTETLTGKTITFADNTITATSAQLLTAISNETGTGVAVFSTSPTLVTPVLGVATATSINGLTISTTTGTLTMTNGKTLAVENTLTFTGTDASSVAFGTGGTVVYTANHMGALAATTSAQFAGVISNETGTGVVVLATSPTLVTPTIGVATATTVNKVTITAPATGSTLTIADGKVLTASNTLTLAGTDSTTMTFPATSGYVMTSTLSTNDADAANGVWGVSNGLKLEGATADGFETTLSPVDPTADQTVSIANAGVANALMFSTLTTNTVGAANSIWGVSNALTFEGATADASEGTITWADLTADVSYIFPDAAAATYSVFLSTLATNAPDIANSVTGASNALVMEGATADGFETTISPVDPTADQTVSIPNFAVAYSLLGSSLTTNTIDAANSIWGVSNGFIFEGATADAHEIRFTPADATADVVYLLPDAAAASYSIMSSTLATNAPNIANSVTGTSNGLVFEGTADASETTISATDATADTTLTFPAKTASGTVEILSVEAEAATDTITAGQLYGSVITNTGAGGAVVLTLPAPAVGMHFRVYLTVAQDVDINPADGTQILALTNATGDAISSAATIGNCIELIALSTTTWAAFAVSGTWSDAN